MPENNLIFTMPHILSVEKWNAFVDVMKTIPGLYFLYDQDYHEYDTGEFILCSGPVAVEQGMTNDSEDFVIFLSKEVNRCLEWAKPYI